MAQDDRDWYRDWWRKKTGYVERSAFRVSETERQKHQTRSAWKRFALRAVLSLFVVFSIAHILKSVLAY